MQLLDLLLLVTRTRLLIHTGVAGVTGCCQLVNQAVTLTVDVVHLRLLSEDFITEWKHVLVSFISSVHTTARVSILDPEHHEATVLTCREKHVILVAESHALDWTRVSLYLAELFHGELPNLNGTRVPCLANSSEEGLAVGKNLNL